MTTQETDFEALDALVSRRRSRRPWVILVLLILAAVIAVVAWLLTRPEEEVVVAEPQRSVATRGRLTTTIELSGSASAASTANLTFAVGGTVVAIEAEVGQAVQARDVLAKLDDSDALRRLETAQVQLRLAEITLEELLDDPAVTELAAAERAVLAAEAQVASAELTLQRLNQPPDRSAVLQAEQAVSNAHNQLSSAVESLNDLIDGPDAAELASAEQAVANARAQLSTAEQSLADLISGPSPAELASAEQAVANGRNQLSTAEQALEDLKIGPTEAEIASADQAVASALNQLSSAQQTLADLTAEPGEAELASARAAIPTARTNLATAIEQTEDAFERVEDAHERFCDRITVLPSTCRADVPLTLEELVYLETESDGSGATLERLADALLEAHAALEQAENAEESAGESLRAAEARLEDLLEPADPHDIYQARQAVEAAVANHAAATARLEELLAPAAIEDLYQADQAVSAAVANLAAAGARYEELLEGVDPDDRFQAEQAIVAAEASYEAARARLAELQAAPGAEDRYQAEQAVAAAAANVGAADARLAELFEPSDDEEIRQAESALVSANASLEEAISRRDELLAGSTASAIERQQQNVRLAEIAVEDAENALEDLVVRAQFDGVIEEINIELGERVSASTAAFVLSTRGQLLIELSVTEAEWFDLEPGRVGLARFDALDELSYAIRIAEAGRVPQIDQGVVTYIVEASILTPEEFPDAADQLAAIGGENAITIGAEGAAGGGVPNPFESAQAKQLLAAFEAQATIPPGVETLAVIRALAFDDPLPEGVILPDGFEIPEQFKAQIRNTFLSYEQALAEAEAEGVVEQPLPAPGMTASVTIITAIRDEAVHVAISAVRQIDGRFYVAIPSENLAGWERIEVEVGESDDSSVEILSGLEAGQVVLIGADTEGVSYAAVLLGAG